MHTISYIIGIDLSFCILFVVYRCWAGGMFETGLEGIVIPFKKANQ